MFRLTILSDPKIVIECRDYMFLKGSIEGKSHGGLPTPSQSTYPSSFL